MRYLFATAAVLLSSALASPYKKHIDSHHPHHVKHYRPVFGNNTVPIGTGTGIVGPTGVSSSNGIYTSYVQTTVTPSVTGTVTASTLSEMSESSIEDTQTINTVNANANNCDDTVTVTVPASTTETVTVSASVNDQASSSPAISTADVTPSLSSAAAAIPSASSKSIEYGSSSVLPTFSAPIAAPVSPASSQAGSEPATPPASTIPSTSAASIETSSVAVAPVSALSATSAPPAETSSTSPVPAPSSSSAPIKQPAPQPGLPFKTKRGVIASGNTQNALTAAIGTGKISWLGDWYSAPPPTLPSTVQFVPQNYNPDSDADGTFTKNAAAQVAKGAKYLFSYGEPAAAKLPVSQVVQLFKKSMQPFADKGITVSAPTTLQTDGDFEWLEQFLQQCQGCSIGFLAIHYMNKYYEGTVNELKTTMNRAHDLATKYGIQGGVWLDNFEVVGSVEEQKGFLQEVVPWLEQQEWVKAYAYVPDEVGKAGSGPNFIDGDGKLNELGRFYADL